MRRNRNATEFLLTNTFQSRVIPMLLGARVFGCQQGWGRTEQEIRIPEVQYITANRCVASNDRKSIKPRNEISMSDFISGVNPYPSCASLNMCEPHTSNSPRHSCDIRPTISIHGPGMILICTAYLEFQERRRLDA